VSSYHMVAALLLLILPNTLHGMEDPRGHQNEQVSKGKINTEARDNHKKPAWQTADFWFGLQRLARSWKRASEQREAKTAVLVIAENGRRSNQALALDWKDLAGEYSVRDGLGYNLTLALREGGAFDCTWAGCLGVYGTASGDWSVDSRGVNLVAKKSDGTLKDRPLSPLRVASFHGHYLLVKESQLHLLEHGAPSRFFCFHKEATGKLLDKEFDRLLRDSLDKVLQEKKKGAG
jgi:hypothetical protein